MKSRMYNVLKAAPRSVSQSRGESGTDASLTNFSGGNPYERSRSLQAHRMERTPEFHDGRFGCHAAGSGAYYAGDRTRYWKLYYAAKENNWTLAHFQLKEIKELMEFGMVTRPKYEEHLDTFIRDDLGAIEKAIKVQDWNAVEAAFQQGITNANDYHQLNDKGFIVWKLPDYPPPDLDLTPQD